MQVRVSKNSLGKVRIDYGKGGSNTTVLFEPIGKNTLESRFDPIGSITSQRLIGSGDTGRVAEDFIAGMYAEIADGEYSDVTLQKECPKCGGEPLARYIDTLPSPTEAPVMPFYMCSKCGTKSYYLTEEYLKSLVNENRELFAESELSELGRDEGAFIQELGAYIIRIFASQRIMRIR